MQINFRPVVYMRDRTHTYIWVRDGRAYGYFLTMDSGSITVEKVPREEVDGQEVYRVYSDKQTFWDLTPYPYDPMKSLKKYHESFLERTDEAEALMVELLGGGSGKASRRMATVTSDPAATKPTKETKAKKASGPGGYSLADLCQELGIDPGEARKQLRSKGVEKPGARWEWVNPEAAASVRKALGG